MSDMKVGSGETPKAPFSSSTAPSVAGQMRIAASFCAKITMVVPPVHPLARFFEPPNFLVVVCCIPT